MPQRDGPEAVLAVKSSALWVIFRTGEVLGGAEMFLICNVGAMHTDRYADLSQTDCMMLCSAPSTGTDQRSVNHQALLFSDSAGTVELALFLGPCFFFCVLLFLFYLRLLTDTRTRCLCAD